MTDQQILHKQLWNIANELRGKMGADEFRDYILGFIFYKYLSDKAVKFANELLDGEGISFTELDDNNPEHQRYIAEIAKNSIAEVGFSLTPNQLFHTISE